MTWGKTMEITTNNQWRDLLHWHELTEKEQNEFIGLMSLESCEEQMYTRYKNWVTCLGDYMQIDSNSSFPKQWHAYHSDSFFSGTLIELSDCGEQYRIATYIS